MQKMNALIIALLPAIAIIESGGNYAAVGDSGKAAGLYQIHQIYVDDVNRIAQTKYTYADRFDPQKSRMMVITYLEYYGKRYEKITGKPVTVEILAAIHNGGPDGWKKPGSIKYAKRVISIMEKK